MSERKQHVQWVLEDGRLVRISNVGCGGLATLGEVVMYTWERDSYNTAKTKHVDWDRNGKIVRRLESRRTGCCMRVGFVFSAPP